MKHIISGEWVHIDNRLSSCIQSNYAELIIKKQPSQVSFIEAIREDDIIIVKALIAAGADVNAINNEGVTPLQVALQRGHQSIVELLRKF